MPPQPAADRPLTVFVPLPPSYRGGTEEYAYRLAGHLAEKFPVRITSTTVRWSEGAANLPLGRATLELLPARELFERPLVPSRARDRVRWLVRGSGVVQVHMPFPRVERWVAEEATAAGVPLILTYHMDADLGAATGTPIGWAVTGLYRRLSARPALAGASAVVSNSRGYAADSPILRRFLPKVRVIAKGIDPSRFESGDRSPSAASPTPASPHWERAPPGAKRLLFVGRLVRYKGVGVLLEAVARLRAGGVGLHLLIAGRGPEGDRLRARADRPDLRGAVTFLGFVPDGELSALYRGADLTVCPSISRLESSPTSLEEAASFGTPTLGSDWPGASESLPNDGVHGLLAPPGAVGAVADGIARLLRDGRRVEAPAVRSWSAVAEEYALLIESLARETGGGGRAPAGRPAERPER